MEQIFSDGLRQTHQAVQRLMRKLVVDGWRAVEEEELLNFQKQVVEQEH